MKPTKSRVMCPQIGRMKMLFETEGSAKRFIQFNGGELTDDVSRLRVYYCDACGGYHISSHKKDANADKRTDRVIDAYKAQVGEDKFDRIIEAQKLLQKVPSNIKSRDEFRKWVRTLDCEQKIKDRLYASAYQVHPEWK